jgi:hypothetical protein
MASLWVVSSSFLCIEAVGKCHIKLYLLKRTMTGPCGQWYEEVYYHPFLCLNCDGPFCSCKDFKLICVEKRVNQVKFQIHVLVYEMTKITNSIQSHKSYRKNKSENGCTRASEYIRGGIRCHGGVSIHCRSITPAVSPFSRLGKRYEPQSRSVSRTA